MASRRPLRGARVCSRNIPPLETGTARGRPRNVGGAGRPVPRTGTWPRRAARGAGKARQLASPVRRGRAGPLHLIHGGALPDPAPALGPRVWRAGHGRKLRRADLLLAAGPLTGVVCISLWISCAKRRQACACVVEMLGIPPPGPAHKRVADWENTTCGLCIQANRELSTRHAAKARK
jgi:hypothetical protein